MGVPIELLRQHAVNESVRDLLTNLVLPLEMTVEEYVVGILDSYENAQKVFNADKPTGQKINFVGNVQVRNPLFGTDTSKYLLTKSYNVQAQVGAELSTVKPLLT